jgi:Raf kinase inhibitor-like YbhB/YbcL family protein
MSGLKISSPAFSHNGMMPDKYTCHGEDVSPPLQIDGVPAEAKSLAIVVDDPDAPMSTWVHWIIWNIDPSKTNIGEGESPGTEGINDFDRHSYRGPCPPGGTHRYFFNVYALDKMLDIPDSSEKDDLEWEMEGHVISKGRLVGLFTK